MKNEQEIVRSVFDAYIRDAKAISTKKDRPTFDILEEVKNRAIKALEQPTCDDCVSVAELEKWLDLNFSFGGACRKLELFERLEKELPRVTPTFPKGATNGDVMKIIFPNIEANEVKTDTGGYIEVKYLDTTDKCDATAFRRNWWNALYKRGNSDGQY